MLCVQPPLERERASNQPSTQWEGKVLGLGRAACHGHFVLLVQLKRSQQRAAEIKELKAC